MYSFLLLSSPSGLLKWIDSNRMRTRRRSPSAQARKRGVLPSPELLNRSHSGQFARYSTISVWPNMHAIKRGETPALFPKLTFAPNSTRCFTTCKWPLRTASMRGLFPTKRVRWGWAMNEDEGWGDGIGMMGVTYQWELCYDWWVLYAFQHTPRHDRVNHVGMHPSKLFEYVDCVMRSPLWLWFLYHTVGGHNHPNSIVWYSQRLAVELNTAIGVG